MDNRDELISITSGSTNVKVGETADIVILIGPDDLGDTSLQQFYGRLQQDCEAKGLKYVILGNGLDAINTDDFDNLPKANHIAILAHGANDPENYNMHLFGLRSKDDPRRTYSAELIQTLQYNTGATKIIANGCWSGKINEDVQNSGSGFLLPDTEIITAASPEAMVQAYSAGAVIQDFVTVIAESKAYDTTVSMNDMFGRCLLRNPETMTYGNNIPEGYQNFTARREDRATLSNPTAERWINHNIANFNEFLFNIDVSAYMPPPITQAYIESYRKQSFLNHLWHCDVDQVEAILKNDPDILKSLGQNETSALFFAMTNIGTYETHSAYGRSIDPKGMLAVLIEHDPKELERFVTNAFNHDPAYQQRNAKINSFLLQHAMENKSPHIIQALVIFNSKLPPELKIAITSDLMQIYQLNKIHSKQSNVDFSQVIGKQSPSKENTSQNPKQIDPESARQSLERQSRTNSDNKYKNYTNPNKHHDGKTTVITPEQLDAFKKSLDSAENCAPETSTSTTSKLK
jgi:hypothetical protein